MCSDTASWIDDVSRRSLSIRLSKRIHKQSNINTVPRTILQFVDKCRSETPSEMSVVSSRTSSVASILKGPGVRAKLVGQQNRVNFKLPKNLKAILLNFENGCDRKVYEDLICTLRDAKIKDNELLELIVEVRQCISLLGSTHKLFIEVLLNINWTSRSPEATTAYKGLLEDLVCVHIYHCKFVMDKLVCQFRPMSDGEAEWEDGKPREEDSRRLYHVHDVLYKFLKIVPMCSELLLQSLSSRYPYHKSSTHAHEIYVHSLLQILEYAPQLRSDILSLIINRLVVLDVNAPRSDIESYREDGMEEDDDGGGAIFKIDSITDKDDAETEPGVARAERRHPLAHTLDVCMEMLLAYVHKVCHPRGSLEMESLKSLYLHILKVFETTILPTWASHHVQFVMFYLCSFKPSVAEAFLNWLWQKVSNPNVAPVLRQSAVAYIASLLARATFVPISTLTRILFEMVTWTHSYIAAQDSLECANSDVRVHTVFYSVCQAMFYIIGFRHKDLVDTRKNLLFMQSLNLTKIVTCRLNPLRVCLPTVVQHFATVTRSYQLAYCYTVIEHNSRSNLPVLQTSNRFATWLDTFFPFDPYVLERSEHRIAPIYLHYQGTVNFNSTDSASLSAKDETDEDDFMESSFSHQQHDSHNRAQQFSYSTSPGFLHS